jgi:acyl dehydratase
MKVSPKHILDQGPVIRTLLQAVADAVPLGPFFSSRRPGTSTRTIHKETLPPRSAGLVKDYVRHVGGEPSWYCGILPAHMFPQWGFPVMAKTLRSLNYSLVKILNAGCRIEIRSPLPADAPLLLRAKLKQVDDDGKRALLTQRLITGTADNPESIISHVTAVVPVGKKKKDGHPPDKSKKEKTRVPTGAREIARLRLGRDIGVDYGVVTGDINPIHWLVPYARMSGFKNPILHGFSALARTVESLNRSLWSGDVNRLKSIDVRFVRPLVLPANVGIFIDGDGGVFMGEAPGVTAYLAGEYESR